MKHIVAREDGEDKNSKKSQRGASMNRKDKELGWSTIGS